MIVYNLIRIFGDNPDNQRKKWVLSGTAIESLYFFLNFPQTTQFNTSKVHMNTVVKSMYPGFN